MIRRPPRSTRVRSSAASDVYKRQGQQSGGGVAMRPAHLQWGHNYGVWRGWSWSRVVEGRWREWSLRCWLVGGGVCLPPRARSLAGLAYRAYWVVVRLGVESLRVYRLQSLVCRRVRVAVRARDRARRCTCARVRLGARVRHIEKRASCASGAREAVVTRGRRRSRGAGRARGGSVCVVEAAEQRRELCVCV